MRSLSRSSPLSASTRRHRRSRAGRRRRSGRHRLSRHARVEDLPYAPVRQALRQYPRLRKLFADGGCAGPKLASALAGEPVEIEIVKRTDKDVGFKVIRRRWVIERTFSWLRRNRRLMAHYDALAMVAVRFAQATDLRLAMICDANFRFRL